MSLPETHQHTSSANDISSTPSTKFSIWAKSQDRYIANKIDDLGGIPGFVVGLSFSEAAQLTLRAGGFNF
jgi:hypothetical protein